MSRRFIAASSAVTLAACVAAPGSSFDPGLDKSVTAPAEIGAAKMHDPQAISAVQGEENPNFVGNLTTVLDGEEDGRYPSITSLDDGEEEDGSGTVVTTMALGEEDGYWPPVTSMVHGEEEDGSGTMIEDQPLDPSELFSLRAEPDVARQIASVADIMSHLNHAKGYRPLDRRDTGCCTQTWR